MGSIAVWQPFAHEFWSCSTKRARVVPPAEAGLGGGTFAGGGGSDWHISFVYTNLPRRTGFEPSALPVSARKLPCVSRPARCLGSRSVFVMAVPEAVTPYSPASAPLRYE